MVAMRSPMACRQGLSGPVLPRRATARPLRPRHRRRGTSRTPARLPGRGRTAGVAILRRSRPAPSCPAAAPRHPVRRQRAAGEAGEAETLPKSRCLAHVAGLDHREGARSHVPRLMLVIMRAPGKARLSRTAVAPRNARVSARGSMLTGRRETSGACGRGPCRPRHIRTSYSRTDRVFAESACETFTNISAERQSGVPPGRRRDRTS
jgi:hypothetical protein